MEQPTLKEQIVFICYGNHPKNTFLRNSAEKILTILYDQGKIMRSEIAILLNLDLKSNNDLRRYGRLMKPLLGKNKLRTKFIKLDKKAESTTYLLIRNFTVHFTP